MTNCGLAGDFESSGLHRIDQVLPCRGAVKFDLPGGGFLNLDTYSRCAAQPGAKVFSLLGEGTFHQVHGGTTTNVSPAQAQERIDLYRAQYESIRGFPYRVPEHRLEFFGSLHPRSFLV